MAETTATVEEAPLADRLSFQLYTASRALVAAYRQHLRKFDLSYPQYLALQALWAGDGRTVSELCAELELDSGTVSPMLARLEADGYLVRERTGADGRQVRVFCTEAGLELQHRVTPVPGDVAADTGLTEADYGALCGTLNALRAALRGA